MTVVAQASRTAKTHSRAFLPEVQALRAAAVLLVVVYHLWPGRLPGGFVGVDVFFVISGFLITLHLLGSLLESGRVRLLRFWANRIWRLLPASLVVLAVCWVFTVMSTPLTTASNALKQIGAASAYVVNWVLAFDSVDYLARDNVPTIVQHYWSLSVEEQFYVLWPLLLTAIVACAGFVLTGRRREIDRDRRANWLLAVILILAISSFAYSILTTHFIPARAYFDTFTRAWEFAAGGLLAVVVTRFPAAVQSLRAHPLVAAAAVPQIVGFILIGASGLLMSSSTPFPSGWAGIPVLGTVLVMLGGAPRAGWFTGTVGWRPVQFIGDISYSLYLWHWPLIIGFSIVASRRHSIVEGIGLLVAAFVLAWLTKILIEDPVRRRGRRTVAVWPAFLVAVVGAAVLIAASTTVVQARAAQAEAVAQQQLEQIVDETGCTGANATLGTSECETPFALTPGANPVHAEKDLDPGWCLTWFDQEWLSCDFGDAGGEAGTVAIVGDSHAAALTNPFGDYLADKGWRLETFTRFGCPGLSQSSIGLRAQTPETEQACADWSQRVLDELTTRDDIDMVVFTSFESAYAQPEAPGAAQLTSGSIERTLGAVADSGKRVVLMRDFAATGGVDIPTCVASTKRPDVDCSMPVESAYPPGPFDQAIADLGDRISVVSPQPSSCDAERCYGVVGDVVVYADDNHVSETFARSLMPYLGPALIDGVALEARSRG
ncbi:acyltransferase family protein [Microbacterium sp. ZW T6_19]|uniref:acyltransferase family protein n=1 Tax=Microbacterium sp. ZW T6_19 TaxID=3378082 RepID=UPI00385374D5